MSGNNIANRGSDYGTYKGLNEYVKNEKYRKALNLPNEQEEEYTMLAQESIILITASRIQRQGKNFCLRVNCGSQMHLENQIGYECHALQIAGSIGKNAKSALCRREQEIF